MAGIKSILGLDTEGFPKVFDQFSKINELKDSFEGKTRLQAEYTATLDTSKLEKQKLDLGPAIATPPSGPKPETIFSRMRDTLQLKKPDSDETEEIKKGKKDARTETAKQTKKFTDTLEKNTKGLTNTASAFASLNPVQFVQAFTSMKYGFVAELAGSAGNVIWGGLGDAAKAVIKRAADYKNIAMGAASAALNTVKTAMPQEIQRRSDVSAAEFYGGGLESKQFKTVMQGEFANVIRGLSGMYGKLQPQFEKQFTKLFSADKLGNIVNRDIAGALAQGKFSALGTDQGFFMEKISQAGAGLPPSVRQKLNAALLAQVNVGALKTEKDSAREAGKKFDERRLKFAEKVSEQASSVQGADAVLTNLSVNMVANASRFSSVLASSAEALNTFLEGLNKMIKTVQADADAATTKAKKQKKEDDDGRSWTMTGIRTGVTNAINKYR